MGRNITVYFCFRFFNNRCSEDIGRLVCQFCKNKRKGEYSGFNKRYIMVRI